MAAASPTPRRSAFSKQNLTTGEGGMITTGDTELAVESGFYAVREDRNGGTGSRSWLQLSHDKYPGRIGLAQMEDVADHIEARHRVAGWYRHYLDAHLAADGASDRRTLARHAYWMLRFF